MYMYVFVKLHVDHKIRPFRARFDVYTCVCCADHPVLLVLIFPNRDQLWTVNY